MFICTQHACAHTHTETHTSPHTHPSSAKPGPVMPIEGRGSRKALTKAVKEPGKILHGSQTLHRRTGVGSLLPLIPPLPQGQSTSATNMPPASCTYSPIPQLKQLPPETGAKGPPPVQPPEAGAPLPFPLADHDLPLSCFSPSFSHCLALHTCLLRCRLAVTTVIIKN